MAAGGDGALAAGGGQPGPLPLARPRTGAGRCPPRRYPAPRRSTPRRNAPWAAALASWPGRSSRAKCTDRRTKGHSRRAGTPRIVRVGPSTRKGTRRSLLTAPQTRSAESIFGTHPCARSLCRPGGPDGEGQARGQARNARGEPPQAHVVLSLSGQIPPNSPRDIFVAKCDALRDLPQSPLGAAVPLFVAALQGDLEQGSSLRHPCSERPAQVTAIAAHGQPRPHQGSE